MPATGVVRTVAAVALALTSNTIQNSVDIFRQTDAPPAGSNTATSILTSPITLVERPRRRVRDVSTQPGSLLTAGDVLELRTNCRQTGGLQPSFEDLTATVEIERT